MLGPLDLSSNTNLQIFQLRLTESKMLLFATNTLSALAESHSVMIELDAQEGWMESAVYEHMPPLDSMASPRRRKVVFMVTKPEIAGLDAFDGVELQSSPGQLKKPLVRIG